MFKGPDDWNQRLQHDTSTSSDHAWSRCVSFLQTCNKLHTRCWLELSPKRILPTRLIDVGLEGVDPRLVLSCNCSEDLKYLTLSHCWGLEKLPILTQATYNEFQNGIPSSKLSPTFRDAVLLTRRFARRFGVRYLWIDALCIFQDSEDGWRQEGAKMADVYGGAWCNLAAAHGVDGNTGLYSERSSPILPLLVNLTPIKVAKWEEVTVQEPITQVRESIGQPENLFSKLKAILLPKILTKKSTTISTDTFENPKASKEGTYAGFDAALWDRIESSALNTRGWVYQERILSRRILYFNKGEIAWECQEHRATETFPEGEFHHNRYAWKVIKEQVSRALLCDDDALQQSLLDSKELDQDDKYYFTKTLDKLPRSMYRLSYDMLTARFWVRFTWTRIIATYSACSITRSEDKLVAISGVARRMSNHFSNSTYLAGLWSLDLEPQLLWISAAFVDEHKTWPSRPSKYRAPSWSWACLDGAITMVWPRKCEEDYQRVVEILTASTTTVTPDTFGQVSDGILRLKGFLCKGRCDFYRGRLLFLLEPPGLLPDNTGVLQTDLDTCRKGAPKIELYFMPILLSTSYSKRCLHGLALKRVKGSRGAYRRVGVFRKDYPNGYEGHFNARPQGMEKTTLKNLIG